MGAGLHGTNGLPPNACLKLYTTYVLPRLMFGLEALVITKAQTQKLETFHRRTLRCIQRLPECVATAAIYLLIGEVPIAAKLHIKIANLLQSIAEDPESVLYKVGLRQSASKNGNSKSWFIYANAILSSYDLPLVQDILTSRPKKGPWKKYITGTITSFWNQ